MARMLAWFAIAAAAAYVVFIGGSWWGIYRADLRVVTVALSGALLGAWGWLAWRRPAWRPRSSLLPAILLALGSLAISTIFSREPRISLEYLGYAIVLAALYLFGVSLLRDPFFRPRLVGLSILLFGVITVAYLGLVGAHWVTWWSALGDFAIPPLRPEFEGLTYGNPSPVLTISALLAVGPAARWGGSSRRGLAVLAILGALVTLIALLTGSRAGWFALGIAGFVGVIALLSGRDRRAIVTGWLSTVLRGPGARVGATIVGVAVVVAVIGLGPTIIRRLSAGGEDLRIGFWVAALRLFQQAPIVGTGPGTWVIERAGATIPPESDYYIPHAHDVPVQVLAELGVVGAVVGVVALMLVARLVWRAASSTSPDLRRWGWLTGLGLLYFGLHNLLDSYVNAPAILVAAALPLAYLDASIEPEPLPRIRALSRLPRAAAGPASVAGIVLVSVAVVGLLAQEIPALELQRAVDAANQGRWDLALAPARDAAALDPDIGSADFTAGLASAQAGDHKSAAAYFEQVVRHEDFPEAWLDLAAERAALGDRAGAATALRGAIRLGYQRAAVAMPGGVLALQLGDTALASDFFVGALDAAPSLAADPWWASNPDAQAIKADVVDRAIAQAATEDAWQIALMAGDPTRARQLATDIADVDTAGVIAAWAGDGAAAARVEAECRSDPHNIPQLSWCARIAQRTGDATSAAAFRYLADSQLTGTAAKAAELRITTSWTTASLSAGYPAIYWGTFTYRRPTAYDMFVPDLVQLARQ